MPSSEKIKPPGPGSRVHLLGVGGSGMSALAHMLLDAGCRVSGSDLQRGTAVRALEERGMLFQQDHEPGAVRSADIVVYSSAIRTNNSELIYAVQNRVPVLKRAEMLANLIQSRKAILVAGTHGKTTSSLMLSRLFMEAGRDPGYYIGAEVPSLGRNAALGTGPEVVVEADESDGTIACYQPHAALVLNIEEDHLDHYGNFAAIVETFRGVISRVDRVPVLCADDPVCRLLAPANPLSISYALDHDADFRATGIDLAAGMSRFTVHHRERVLGDITLSLPGRHNVSNALGVIAVALSLDVEFGDCQRALAALVGPGRRFETRYLGQDYHIVDDYAHHPSEIRATLAAARRLPRKRVLALFQPHRYSRTAHLLGQFTNAFEDADRVVVTEIYGAGEDNPTGLSARTLCEGSGHRDKPLFAWNLEHAKALVAEQLVPGDVLVTMGAGNVHLVAGQIAADLKQADLLRPHLESASVFRCFEPMRKHTTLRVGGPAQMWLEPTSEEELSRVLACCRSEGIPVTVIGRGSNLLVRDGGIRGLCLHLGRAAFTGLRVENGRLVAGAGVRLREIAYMAKKHGLAGMEFMEGIPGNLGGSLKMNAGAMQSWMFEVVESVRLMDLGGKVFELPREKIEAGYRHVPLLQNHIVLGATLLGRPEAPSEIEARLAAYSRKRWDSQPAAPSAGCTFKNTDSIPAGRLIDELGLKDRRVGGARVSPVHANFLVNDGGATASDMLTLIGEIRETALKERGIELELEVQVVGEDVT
ncbi:MAG: UDP-N-acetylmuramate--L-alanine ligase [Candidatus Methylacidiphilales bacterium]|nr:UDP-N-acetylmuramate--L-alanine ligase [Candidatus Methylacidiphilales bacterium]